MVICNDVWDDNYIYLQNSFSLPQSTKHNQRCSKPINKYIESFCRDLSYNNMYSLEGKILNFVQK